MIFSSFETSEKVFFSVVLCATYAISFVLLFMNFIRIDLKAKQIDAIEEANEKVYSNAVLCAWDNNMVSEIEVDDYSGGFFFKLFIIINKIQ